MFSPVKKENSMLPNNMFVVRFAHSNAFGILQSPRMNVIL